jgi:hypothetical protein
VARRLPVLPRAVQRIDDPHPLGSQPDLIVRRLLAQNRVSRPLVGQPSQQQLVRPEITRGPQFATALGTRAHVEQ